METADLLRSFHELDTPSVSDALDGLGLKGACEGLRPLFGGARAVGLAFTVGYRSAGEPPGTVGDYIDDVGKDQVVVLDNQGRTDCTVWGDLLTRVGQRRGVAGTVIDGVCRDVPAIVACGYPVFSKGAFMRTGKDRVEVVGVNIPVRLSRVRVEPGDLVVADDSGVVVVPFARSQDVLALAKRVAAAEGRIERWVESGLSLREAREREGYHALQR